MSRWMLIATLGCGHAAPAPPPPPGIALAPSDAAVIPVIRAAPALDDDLLRLAARSLRLYQELAQTVGAGGDCAALTAEIDALATAYADVVAANARVLQDGRAKVMALKQALAPHQADIDAAAKTIADAPAMARCAGDAAFVAAMDRLVGEP